MTMTMMMRNLLDLGLLSVGLARRPSRVKLASGLLAAGACGAAAGAVAALLLAPAEGKATRAKLARKLDEALPHLGNGVKAGQDWGRPARVPAEAAE